MATHAPAEVRRAQILEAALACFAGKGFHAARMDDIVRASGLSKGALYWHFESKDEIFLALFEEFEKGLLAEWDALPEGPALPTLERLGALTLERLLATRPLLDTWNEFMRHPTARERFAGVYGESRRRLTAIVEAGVAAGEIGRVEPGAVAAGLTALIEGLLLQAFADGAYDPRVDWPGCWAVFERGLRPD